MKTFNNLEEMKQYYNENTNTYEFVENGSRMDIKIEFDLEVDANIKAWNINAWDIKAGDIKAWNIKAGDIKAGDIKAWNINAGDINAGNIDAGDINAGNINAGNISYYAVCFAYRKLKCKSISGRRNNSKHFCLDNEIEYVKQHKIVIDNKEIEISEESYNKLRESLL